MIIKKRCPYCNKIMEVVREFPLAGLNCAQFLCGHVATSKPVTIGDLTITSSDGRKPYPYQTESAKWAIENNARVLIAHEMGLGKTIISLLIAHSNPDEYCPILVVCKSSLRVQWMREIFRWCAWPAQIVEYETDYIFPNIKAVIVGYDSLAYSSYTNKRGKKIERGFKEPEKWINALQPRTIILDECQSVKNKEAKRTHAVQNIVRTPPHLIALSGTPILNNAKEYFPILNMLHPEKFPNESAFVARWCESYWGGYAQKVGGIAKDKIEDFRRFTESFIIRKTRAEVLPDLPKIDRRFQFEELGGAVEEAYKTAFKEFQDAFYKDTSQLNGQERAMYQASIIAYLSKMRHLTGIAKIPGVVDFVTDFMNDTDRKLVVFTHHKDVAKEVVQRLNEFSPIHLEAPVDQSLVDKFWGSSRLMIASTLAAGEGLNLQCCSDCIMMERQWNPPKEEQAEGRFIRIGQTATAVTATYFTAVGTVDEFLGTLVEQKRAIFKATMDGEIINWNEASLMKELAEVLAANGGKRWGF